MRESSKKRTGSPRVFLSYARADGEDFAEWLSKLLEEKDIPFWLDRLGMEGGHDWWLQIEEALNKVELEFLVLIMTPAAMQSPNVRKEWRYARQQGVCVYPVIANHELDFASLPHWMRDVHFYDLAHEKSKFINDLNTRCQRVRVPFMVEDLPADYVPRPQVFEALIDRLLDQRREEPVAITAALRGAGGYGKTTMAKAICHDERMQQAFNDGILWVTLGEKPGNLVDKVEDLIETLSGKRPGFTGIDAATAYFAELLADRDILLVVDDVWDALHLKPFLQGGKRCARLMTTRNEDVLPTNAQNLIVDAMQSDEAVQLLSAGVESAGHLSDERALRLLSARLGEWPLLLKLVNGTLRERVRKNQSVPGALAYINEALNECGLTIFDARDAQDRSQAVAKTLSVSFQLLTEEEYTRYQELAIFPEDIAIPLSTIEKLWGTTGGLGKFKTEKLCEDFSRLSLLLSFDPTTRTIHLHDVIRSYLQTTVGDALPTLHAHLLDAYALKRWADLPDKEPYLWDHLAEHLVAAGRIEELVATLKDLRYIAIKIFVRSVYKTEADFDIAEKHVTGDVSLYLLNRTLTKISHLLKRCITFNDIASLLYSRVSYVDELLESSHAFALELPRPFLIPWYVLPDLSDSALIRTLEGHTHDVTDCAISPGGDWIVSASVDTTLRVWDATTGLERLTLLGHVNSVEGCAVSPAGDFIVSASADTTLKVWDSQTGRERLTLSGHMDKVNSCAVSPAGDYIVSASADTTLKVWDSQTGKVRFTLQGHKNKVTDCAISPRGNWIVSVSDDGTLKTWDAQTGVERLTLHIEGVRSCAVSQQGDYIVSGSNDGTLKIWDAQAGTERLTIGTHRWIVGTCAVSPRGDFIVSGCDDGTLKVWDAQTGVERLTLIGHTSRVRGCAVSPKGDYIVSACWDKTLKIWDAHTAVQGHTPKAYTKPVTGCAVSPLGDYIVLASEESSIEVWDVRTSAKRFSTGEHGWIVATCTVSPRGDFIVSGCDDGTLKVWDAQTGVERLTLIGHESKRVRACAVSPAGDYIVSGAWWDETVIVWDAQTGARRLTLRGNGNGVYGCAVSPAGDYIVSACWDGTLRVWDAQTGAKRLNLRGHRSLVTACAVSPSGDYIVSASWDNTLKEWDAETGLERLTLHGHEDHVNSCAVSPNGFYVISASDDGTIKVWEVNTGSCLVTLPVDGKLHTCTFFPDGEHLVAGGERGLYLLRFML